MFQEEVALEIEEDKIVMDLKSPADYALHAVFIRFASSSEEKIDSFLRLPLVRAKSVSVFLGVELNNFKGQGFAFDRSFGTWYRQHF